MEDNTTINSRKFKWYGYRLSSYNGRGYSSGSYSWDHDRKTPGPLETLDLSRANIVSGGLPYKHTEYFDGRTQRSSIEDYFKYQGDSREFQGSRDGHVYGSKKFNFK